MDKLRAFSAVLTRRLFWALTGVLLVWGMLAWFLATGRLIGEFEKNHGKGRFFLYVQTYDAHNPLAVDRKYTSPYFPQPYRGKLGQTFTRVERRNFIDGKLSLDATDHAWIRALYDGEVTYQDEHFGKLLGKLDQLGIASDTMIVVTNDHDWAF